MKKKYLISIILSIVVIGIIIFLNLDTKKRRKAFIKTNY